ncbi:hypothetical protein DFR33_104117 [Bradymonas sediminis]|nr:hypothetical protein DFR33_104117 [Bradymonas sediminis]
MAALEWMIVMRVLCVAILASAFLIVIGVQNGQIPGPSPKMVVDMCV